LPDPLEREEEKESGRESGRRRKKEEEEKEKICPAPEARGSEWAARGK
jgi:hypothetical protein